VVLREVDEQIHQPLGDPQFMEELLQAVAAKDEASMLKICQEEIQLEVDLEQEGNFPLS
jgi:hypothetical protein